MRSKYQVGDKVRISIPEKYLDHGRYSPHVNIPRPGLNDRMVKQQGKIMTISRVSDYHLGGYKYNFKEGNLNSTWVDWMLSPAIDDYDLF